ncbi:hypothetical protein FHR24_000057 [Wenyingzhuangia heitensis]|uniref:Secretion system C-terminal sorting domain-containing protein n=1 Tax=Wenyingzhuangia heitensis TaxID=1487859 RepID=A0ABX0U421_9FLAO|nr:T9SS type A sorting domain-containing protein [Wenyingzhuangia heitensis]NIJ43618.1 hypothetical protein [Wenyingzhuangia heitensis]
MKIKLLFIFLITTFCVDAQVNDFITGINSPKRLIIDNNVIYVKGGLPGKIYQINLSDISPSASVLFNSLPTSGGPFEIGGLVKVGDVFYISYINDDVGDSTLASFNINTPTVLNNIVTGLGFVNALGFYNNELYFTENSLAGGGATLNKIDVTVNNPTVVNVVGGFLKPQDLEFKNSILYIGDREAEKIYSVDVSLSSPSVNTFVSGVSTEGIYVFNEFLYYTDIGVVKKVQLKNSSDVTTVAEDTDHNKELRDIVISGTTLYMPQESVGKIVTKGDLTLSVKGLDNEISGISMRNDKLTIQGLKKGNNNITIYNLEGKMMMNKELSLNNNSFNVSHLSSGVYVLKINDHVYRFVK